MSASTVCRQDCRDRLFHLQIIVFNRFVTYNLFINIFSHVQYVDGYILYFVTLHPSLYNSCLLVPPPAQVLLLMVQGVRLCVCVCMCVCVYVRLRSWRVCAAWIHGRWLPVRTHTHTHTHTYARTHTLIGFTPSPLWCLSLLILHLMLGVRNFVCVCVCVWRNECRCACASLQTVRAVCLQFGRVCKWVFGQNVSAFASISSCYVFYSNVCARVCVVAQWPFTLFMNFTRASHEDTVTAHPHLAY